MLLNPESIKREYLEHIAQADAQLPRMRRMIQPMPSARLYNDRDDYYNYNHKNDDDNDNN